MDSAGENITLMLEKILKEFMSHLELAPPTKDSLGFWILHLHHELRISVKELPQGCYLYSNLVPYPTKKLEELFVFLMQGNFLGEKTGESTIGLDFEEKFLTLSHVLPYELDYKSFKESIEEFVNFLDYWRDEIEKFLKGANT